MGTRFVPCLAGLVLFAGAHGAFANGRFPRAQRLREDSGDPQRLVLAATYGLLVTDDRGAEWRHICELGYAFSIDDIDPLVEIPPDGSLLVTAAHSLNRSPAPFCAFEPVLGGAGTETVVDYSLDGTDENRVVALFMRSEGGGTVSELYESFDAGKTFSAFGTPLPSDEVAFSVTLDVAPSDSNRIYVSAAGRSEPELLLRSDDRGASWTAWAVDVAPQEYTYIAGVHPTDPDILYVRTDHWALDEFNVLIANDGLFYSDDGGQSFREIHRAAGKLFGFALSPDGSEVLVGYGDPVDSTALVDPAALGIYRASTSDHVFTKIFDGPVSCLAWTGNGLYACTSQTEHGFALGFANNADFELGAPSPLTPLLDLSDVKGPLDCPASSSGAECQESWPENCALFGSCDAGTAGTGTGGAGTAGAGMAGAGGRSPHAADEPSSCGCRTPLRSNGTGAVAALLFAAATIARRGLKRVRAAGARGRAARDS